MKEEMLVKCADELIDDKEQLQQYLKDIYTIETERYSSQEAEEELKYRIENAGQAQVQERVESYYTYYFKEYWKFEICFYIRHWSNCTCIYYINFNGFFD